MNLGKRPKSKFADSDGLIIMNRETINKFFTEGEFSEVIEWDRKFADECDKLSTIEAQNSYTSWGRWFLDDGYLNTWICFPETDIKSVRRVDEYFIGIEKCRIQEQQDNWIKQLKGKRWIGEQGLKDLKRAFKYISKKEKTVEKD